VKSKFPRPEMINGTIVVPTLDGDQVIVVEGKGEAEIVARALRDLPTARVIIAESEEQVRTLNEHLRRNAQAPAGAQKTTSAETDEPPIVVSATGKARVRFRAKAVGYAKVHLPSAPEAAPVVELPPGYRIATLASFILTKGAYQRYVAPQIADMQFEYIEAIKACNERLAQWVRIRGYGLIVWALFGSVLKSLITRLVPSAK
jgi:hypothetical protein